MKTYTEKTYFYNDFITLEEQTQLKEWALANEDKLVPNLAGPNRKFNRLDAIGNLPNLISVIRQRIVDTEEDIKVVAEAPQNGDWIGIQGEGAFVEPHKDYNGTSYYFYTRRYNLIVSLPESGGNPIYDKEVLKVNERTLWRCDAGLVTHSSTPNIGNNPRINISFGFLMPIDTQYIAKHIKKEIEPQYITKHIKI